MINFIGKYTGGIAYLPLAPEKYNFNGLFLFRYFFLFVPVVFLNESMKKMPDPGFFDIIAT